MAADLPRQASLNRLRRFDIRPNRELGQNFLIDDNLLAVIGQAAELGPEDVVLEVGGGLGVLSEYLAPRVGHLHVVEVDRGLEAPLREALEPFANATLHVADAVTLDLPSLDPAPTKVVANLPYGVAATVLLDTVEHLPGATRWVAMVQREVAEPAVSALVHAAFAHRRKALAGSLALAPGAPEGIRERTRTALAEIGQPADARAERLAPADFRRLAELIGAADLTGLRPSGSPR